MLCPVKLVTGRKSTINIKAMIDCKAKGDFIDQTYMTIMGIKKQALDKPITVQNVDGTLNNAGTITHYVNVTLKISEQKWNEWICWNIRRLCKHVQYAAIPGI